MGPATKSSASRPARRNADSEDPPSTVASRERLAPTASRGPWGVGREAALLRPPGAREELRTVCVQQRVGETDADVHVQLLAVEGKRDERSGAHRRSNL